ncbi:MAG: DNA mismatch repair endonuclease MutL [Limnochordaceae bacterium]|nr:DNA mismatch repair endonuclease MutL [Limnochordaceae bacterium]
MGKIVELPPELVHHIAAGEVVQRPASALKELVENSLDAGARRIAVQIGEMADELRVSDDGEGMDPEDARLCFRRHATSKVRTLADLDRIGTLGFRGEALAAISAIADVELLTKTAHAPSGYRVRVVGGALAEEGPAPAPDGTSVWARRLFFNTPARRRFLKSAGAERRACVQIATGLAIARPDVALEVRSKDAEHLATPGSGDARDVMAAVVGVELASQMLALEGERGPFRLRGLVAPSRWSRRSRDHLWIVVNGRWVEDRSIAAAVVRGFEGRLDAGRFPVAVLYLEVDPDLVDVNVHPAKWHVRLRDDRDLFALVAASVERALRSEPPPALRPAARDEGAATPFHSWARESPAAPYGRPGEPGRPVDPRGAAAAALPVARAESRAQPIPGLPEQLPGLQVIGQLLRTYILAQGPRSLVIVDQHVAHERAIYERILRAAEGLEAPPAQRLLVPVTVQVSPLAAEALRPLVAELSRLGLEMEPFGSRHWLVRSVPAVKGMEQLAVQPEDLGLLLEEVADLAQQWPAGAEHARLLPAPWQDRLFKTMACKSAIRAGTPLSMETMRRLVEGLELVDNPYTCPHGRPVVVAIEAEELDRRFGRRTPA